MKAHYRTKNGRITFEVEGSLVKDIFERVAALQDIFDAEEECGMCGSASIRMVFRETDGNRYYELKCLDCGAAFAFGQRRQGGDLFPRRRDKDGNVLPDNGWSKWDRQKQFALTEPPRSQKSARPV